MSGGVGAERLSGTERDELDWLRQENRLLRVENDMLTRLATEYALERHGGFGDPEQDRPSAG